MNKVLIVDASESDRRLMAGLLVKSGYEPIAVETMEAAKEKVAKLPPGAVVVAGLKFRGGTARELVNVLKEAPYKQPLIAIVDNLGNPDAAYVMDGHGAITVIQRPALDKQLLDAVGKYVKDVQIATPPDELLIERPSEEFRKIREAISHIAATDANVIIFGESGMGKEQMAREIYRQSKRLGEHLTVLEAGGAALVGEHEHLSEQNEMYPRISGYFEKAKGGTIIIKNVHLLNFDKQSVLLHILTAERHDVRVICTATSDLLRMVQYGEFRDSLFFQLRQADITVPALRETTVDIPVIADYLLNRYAMEKSIPTKRLDASAKKSLMFHPWPGNVRELNFVLMMSACHSKDEVLSADDLMFSQSEPEPTNSLLLNNPEVEKQRIIEALNQVNGHREKAADLLGISRNTLYKKMRSHGISLKVK